MLLLTIVATALAALAHFWLHGIARHLLARKLGVAGTGSWLRIIDREAYRASPRGARMIAAAAGPAANYLLCALLFLGAALVGGEPSLTMRVRPVEGGPAQLAGVQDGDRITGIDGQPVVFFSDVSRAVQGRGAGVVELEVERGGQPLKLPVQLRGGRLGVMALQERRPVAPGSASAAAMVAPAATLVGMIAPYFQRQEPELRGPVGIHRRSGVEADGRAHASLLLQLLAIYGACSLPAWIVIAALANRRPWQRRTDAPAI